MSFRPYRDEDTSTEETSEGREEESFSRQYKQALFLSAESLSKSGN
jgi:hypothetical protein